MAFVKVCVMLWGYSWGEDLYLSLCFQEIKTVGLEEERKKAQNLKKRKRREGTCRGKCPLGDMFFQKG